MSPLLTEPRTSRRQARADARREQLLAVAQDVFAEKGIHGSTIRDIAQAAGIAEGLIYHYFPGKSALVQAVFAHEIGSCEIEGLVHQLNDVPVEEALLRLLEGLFGHLTRHQKFVRVVVAEAIRDPEVAGVLGGFIGPNVRAVHQFFEGRVRSGELRPHDPSVPVRLIQGSILWYFLMRERLALPLPPLEPEQYLAGVVHTLLDGLRQGEGAHEPSTR